MFKTENLGVARELIDKLRVPSDFYSEEPDAKEICRLIHYAGQALREGSFPDKWENLGELFEAIGDYDIAADMYRHAAGASIGHNRSARYHAKEKELRDLHKGKIMGRAS